MYLHTTILSVLNLRLHAWAPSDHLCSTLLLPTLPQLLNQAPPGAQQLALPDFSKMPHFEHVIRFAVVEVVDSVLSEMAIGVLTTSSLSGIGRRDTYECVTRTLVGVGIDTHTVWDIDPNECTNMLALLALE